MEVDNFFDHIRPEFFLMVNAKTYGHLSVDVGPGNYRLRQPYNYLFKILFDCELISEFDEAIYMPSKPRGKKTKYLGRPKKGLGKKTKESSKLRKNKQNC